MIAVPTPVFAQVACACIGGCFACQVMRAYRNVDWGVERAVVCPQQAKRAVHRVSGAGREVAAHGERRPQSLLRADSAQEGRPDQEHLAYVTPGSRRSP
jgi:hypothetical protein